MRTYRHAIKKMLRAFVRALPRSLKSFIRNSVAELAGTRELRDTLRQYYGDFEIYNQLLKNKSDTTEYHVDKIIRTIGEELVELRLENQQLRERVVKLERITK